MASKLLELQNQVLSLEDEERALDEQHRALQEELESLEHLYAEDDSRRILATSCLKYLNALSSAVKSKRNPQGQTSIAGEFRIQLSSKESVVLEVGADTIFGDVVEEVLDYLGYPRPTSEQPGTSVAGSTPTQVRLENLPRVKKLTDSSTSPSLRYGPVKFVRPRTDFCLRDQYGAIFCNENKVAETFASSAVLWMAYLGIRSDLNGAAFDPEEEITAFFQAPESVDLALVNQEVANRGSSKTQGLNRSQVKNAPSSGFFIPYDVAEASRSARALLVEVRAKSKSSHVTYLDPFASGNRKLKQMKKQMIAQANDRRNQSRRQGLLLECLIHLLFVIFCFLTAFVYSSYLNVDPEYVANIYKRDLKWNVESLPTFDSYFETRIMPFKRARVGRDWNVGEVRIRQLRVDCTEFTQCDKYQAPSDPGSLEGVSFNSAAAAQSDDPESFTFRLRGQDLPIISLTEYWDELHLVTDYDNAGGYFKFWPSPSGSDLSPNFTNWIDAGTVFVAIEFNVYEPDPNIIVSVKVIAQFPSYRTGVVPEGLDSLTMCGFVEPRILQPVVLVQTTTDINSIDWESTSMTVLCAFALFAGFLSILRGLGFLNISISGDGDIARAVEVYKPNAGLLRSAMMALKVSRSDRSFNPSDITRVFWLLLDLSIVALLITALVYQYVVVRPLHDDLRAYASLSPFFSTSGIQPSSSSSVSLSSNYTEVYGVIRDANVVTMLLAFASWLAIFSGIRELRLISSGVLIADTVTQSILPQLFVLFVCGYAPLGIAFASVGYIMFGYLDSAFQSLELSSYTVVSKFFFFDIIVAPTWRPLYSLLILVYYTVTSGIAYAVIFDAFQRESSKLVKGPFTIWEVLWPFPTIRSWILQENKNDLWAGNLDRKEVKQNSKQTFKKRLHPTTATVAFSETGNLQVAQDTASHATPLSGVKVSDEPERDSPKKLAPSGQPGRISTIAGRDGVDSSFRESLDVPEEREDVSYRRTSITSVDPPGSEDTNRPPAGSV